MARFTRTATKFITDPTCITKLRVTPEMGIAMGVRADNVAEAARQIAPVGKGIGGHYRDQIDSDVRIVGGEFIGRVNAHKFTSAWLEFGSRTIRPPRAILRRAAEMVGLHFEARRRYGGKRV